MIDHFHFWVNYPRCVGQCAVSGTRSPAWGNTAWKTDTISAAKRVCEPIRCQMIQNAHRHTHEFNPRIKRFFYQVLELLMISVKREPTAQVFCRTQGHSVSSYRTAFNWSLRNRTDCVQCSGLYFTSDHNLAARNRRLPSRTPDTQRSISTCSGSLFPSNTTERRIIIRVNSPLKPDTTAEKE